VRLGNTNGKEASLEARARFVGNRFSGRRSHAPAVSRTIISASGH
jgi:hypothetical protein